MKRWLGSAFVLLLLLVLGGRAEERSFSLSGATLSLTNVSAEVDVFYRSMRFNRGTGQWNLEVVVSNKSVRPLTGPLVLVAETVTGSAGALAGDGVDGAGKTFYDLSGRLGDGVLEAGEVTAPRTIALATGTGTPTIAARVFAFAPVKGGAVLARSLNDVGQPLGGVGFNLAGGASLAEATSFTDGFSGLTTLAGEGVAMVQFSAAGYLPVWRRVQFNGDTVQQLPSPRLSPRNPLNVLLTPLSGGQVTARGVQVDFPPGSVPANVTATLTALTPQTLPFFLPNGWSPLSAFWLELTAAPSVAPKAKLSPAGAFQLNETGALMRWNAATFQWDVLELVSSTGTNAVTVTLPGPGAFALVVGDLPPHAPPAPSVSQPLASSSLALPTPGNLSASGSLNPTASPASTTPEFVTATATVIVSNSAGAMPSGVLLRCEVNEDYRLSDGSQQVTPQYENFVVGYQRPGDTNAATVQAVFPVRPLRLLGPQELREAVVNVDVLTPDVFRGQLLGTNGGQLAQGDLRLLLAPGDLTGPSASALRVLGGTNFLSLVPTNFMVIEAFELMTGGLRDGARFAFARDNVPTNGFFVLARVLQELGYYGLQPVERFRSDAQGRLVSLETNATERLPGVTRAGQYLLLQVPVPQTLVQGQAKNSLGNVAGGLLVKLAPWSTLSRTPDGFFQLLGTEGNRELTVLDPATGDAGGTPVTIPTGPGVINATVGAGAVGPSVVSIAPANNATNVARVTSVTVRFSRAVNPLTVLNNGLQLLASNGAPVVASLSLNSGNTVATLLPATTLEPAARYSVVVATNVADPLGRTLEGTNTFAFTTVGLPQRDLAAQLIIYAPGATNVPANVLAQIPGYTPGSNRTDIVVRGTPGVADPGVAVILANESTGETATVLSKPDGSFASVISGAEEDFVSATFINRNGTRVYVPVSRQLFDNGFVGLYRSGGILEAESDGGPVQVLIQPEAVKTRAKFRLKPITVAQLLQRTGGVAPETGTIAGRALEVEVQGSSPAGAVKVKMPVNLAALGYPTNELPTTAAIAMTILREVQGQPVYEVVDQMRFTPNAAPLARGVAGKGTSSGLFDSQESAGVVENLIGFDVIPQGFVADAVLRFVVVPMLLGPREFVIKGKVYSIPAELAQNFDSANFAGGFVPLANELLSAAQRRAARPLGGAYVVLNQLVNPVSGPPGRLRPGMVYATSGANGEFLMVAPSLQDLYMLSVTHPSYQERMREPIWALAQLSLAGVVFKDFYFQYPVRVQTPPSVSISNTPQWPSPGQETEVNIIASQAVVAPEIGVRISAVNNLFGGPAATLEDAKFTNIVETTNGTTRRWTAKLRSDKAVQVLLRATIQSQNGAGSSIPVMTYAVNFSGPPPAATNSPIPAPDTNDVHGPLVISTLPAENGFVDESGALTIFFNKPIDTYIKDHPEGVVLGGASEPLPPPLLDLSADQQTLRIQFSGLEPDQDYTLALSGVSVRDLAGKPLDQRPSTADADSFTMRFRTAPAPVGELSGISSARGSVISGQWLYVIDNTPQGGFLRTYSLRDPAAPALLGSTRLYGSARDIILVPKFSFKRSAEAPVETADVLVVVGGDLDAAIGDDSAVTVRGQFLSVINVADPLVPEFLASPVVSYRVGSAVTKARWSPPYVVYQEFGADIQLLGFVNLQELIFGFGSPDFRRRSFPVFGRDGEDLNGDGDYVDAGEKLPIPERDPLEFYGKKQNYVMPGSSQKILDFSVIGGGRVVGVTLTSGKRRGSQGQLLDPQLSPSYRTLVFNGFPQDLESPTNASVFFLTGAYPRWVTLFDGLAIETNGLPVILPAAVVSLAPDGDGLQKLAVIDMSTGDRPRVINQISIPEGLLGGAAQTLQLLPDGSLELAGTRNRLLLDSRKFGATNAPGQLHPAIIGFLPGAGGVTRSLGSSDFGLYAVADGGRGSVIQTAPKLQFVNFPGQLTVVEPAALQVKEAAELDNLLLTMRVADAIPPARFQTNLNIPSDLTPPRPAAHYHVFVTAPGDAGRTIELGLESVNLAGRALNNPGKDFAPVRAVSESAQNAIGQKPRPGCGAPIRSLTAWRMSNDPNSPYYNRYLSRPFALLANERISAAQIAQLQTQLDREILWSGAALRAFIDPSQSQIAGLSAFAAEIDSDRKLIQPIASATAFTLDAPYVMGDNPPPAGGTVSLPGTFDSVSAHNGEFRTEATDIELPSPRMPIVIQRAIGNQDTYEGPFGVGWDFNYAQRLTVLEPQLFPSGLQMPVLARGDAASSEIAGSQDVLFQTGMGRTVLFKWKNTNMPPEYAADPLVTEFNYAALVSDYFLPEQRQGVFDLLVKFKDGRFERLTPDGTRFRYGPEGRLENIIDRFPKNRHDLEYDRNGWLVRIDDRSVSADRFVEFGYYRRTSDPDFVAGLDEPTSNSYLEGKICRLRDYAKRDVLYFYSDDGFLIRREGMLVAGENGGFSGRTLTQYNYRDCHIVGVTSGADGAPLFNADVVSVGGGKPVVQAGTGASAVQFNIPVNNSAANLNGQNSKGTQADGRVTEIKFDALGHPTSIKTSGAEGEDSETLPKMSAQGLLERMQHPEGRIEEREYDSANPIFRSRANLKRITVTPGPRGGEGYTETFNYDPRYNLPSGAHQDANGFTHSYALRPDGRAVASITRGASGVETTTHDDNGQVLVSVDIRGVRTEMTYDASTAFLKSSKLGDHSTTYGYDASVASKLGRPASITPPAGAPTQIKYNTVLQVVEMTRSTSNVRHAYDERGHEVLTREDLGDGKVRVVKRVFDAKGFMTSSTTESVEVDGAPVALTYEYTPDELSRVKKIKHPGNTEQTFTYDKRNEVTKMTLGSYSEEYRRDRHGNIIELKQGGDIVATTEYDGLDRPKRVLKKTGTQDESEVSTYFPGGQPKTSVVSDPTFGIARESIVGSVDELGRPKQMTAKGVVISPVTTLEYLPLESTVTGPRMAVRSTWSAAGYPLTMQNPVKSITFHPDAAGRVEQVDHIEDGFTYKEFTVFNGLDQITSKSDLLGLMATFMPRNDGKNTSIINARNHATTFDHSVLGEVLQRRREDGLEFRFRHDPQRQKKFTGDPAAGFGFSYDGQFRLTQRTQRDGQPVVYQNFDPREMPQSVQMPGGGTATIEYDLQRRPKRKTTSFQGTTYEQTIAYDALGRVRVTTYRQDGGAANTATMSIDPSGVLVQARYQEAGADFSVNYGYYADGARQTVTYPSGHIVTENRDVSGRLLGISDTGGNILSAVSWQGHNQPKELLVGSSIRQINQFDTRGRMTASRFTRTGDNAVLAHLRSQFDGANNVEAQQYLHRGGRADFFTYDNGERLSRAQIGAIPLTGNTNARVLYERNYNYQPLGLDYLTTVAVTGVVGAAPAFATNWTAHDSFLQPAQVNGFNRGNADPLGRVSAAQLLARETFGDGPVPQAATLIHNGRGDLIRIERADGFVMENLYQPNGLRFLRRVTRNSIVLETRHYVYDDRMRLLEEYDRSGATPALLARYFYGNDDAPVAADLWDFGAGALKRVYYLRDGAESVVAVADAAGNVIERIWYDPFGQPVIEQPDAVAPTLQRIVAGAGGSLLVALSETVAQPVTDPGAGAGIVRYNAAELTGALTVSVNSTNLVGTVELLPVVSGYAPFSVLKFTPAQALPDGGSSLLGWWPGDAQVADVIGGNSGALRGGATVGSGANQQAFALNGTGAFVEITNAAAGAVGASDFTVSLWVNFGATNGEQVLVEKWIQSTRAGWSLLKSADGRLRLAVGNGAGGEAVIESSPLSFGTNRWVQVAARRQGNQFTLFTNGVAIAGGNQTFDLSANTTLKFGSREGTSSFFNGRLDEVTLYSRALTDGEITSVAGGSSIAGPLTVTLNSSLLADEWGNRNAGAQVSFAAIGQEGVVYFDAEPAPNTAAVRTARSSVGSPFLFHGQYFDYDSGLIYLRARFYDPFSGMFLEPDPVGYGDSVNLYAGMGNNPVTFRDPSGLTIDWTKEFAAASASVRKIEQRAASTAPAAVIKSTSQELKAVQSASANLVNKSQNTVTHAAKPLDRLLPENAVKKWGDGTYVLGLHRKIDHAGGKIEILEETVKRLKERGVRARNFMNVPDPHQVLDNVEEVAVALAQGRARVMVHLEHMVGDTPQEKILSAILRGGRHEEGASFVIKGAEHFDLTPKTTITTLLGESAGFTDREMYRLYKQGALSRATFIEYAEHEGQLTLKSLHGTQILK